METKDETENLADLSGAAGTGESVGQSGADHEALGAEHDMGTSPQEAPPIVVPNNAAETSTEHVEQATGAVQQNAALDQTTGQHSEQDTGAAQSATGDETPATPPAAGVKEAGKDAKGPTPAKALKAVLAMAACPVLGSMGPGYDTG